MVLIFLFLLCNHDNLIGFKAGNVPGMVNKEVLAQFIYGPA